MKFQEFKEHERRVVVLETGLGLFEGLDLVSDSEAFPLVSDWEDSGLLIKTGRESAKTVMTDNNRKESFC